MSICTHKGIQIVLHLPWLDLGDFWLYDGVKVIFNQISSVHFSSSVVSDSLWPHGLQHARPPCPSPTPRVYSNPCPLSQWCHPTISSSVVPISSCVHSFPTSGSFPMSQFFASGGQSIGASASASVLPMTVHSVETVFWILISSPFPMLVTLGMILCRCWAAATPAGRLTTNILTVILCKQSFCFPLSVLYSIPRAVQHFIIRETSCCRSLPHCRLM